MAQAHACRPEGKFILKLISFWLAFHRQPAIVLRSLLANLAVRRDCNELRCLRTLAVPGCGPEDEWKDEPQGKEEQQQSAASELGQREKGG
eukprot:3795207-Pleurochrysis_carterae.AAC.1